MEREDGERDQENNGFQVHFTFDGESPLRHSFMQDLSKGNAFLKFSSVFSSLLSTSPASLSQVHPQQ